MRFEKEKVKSIYESHLKDPSWIILDASNTIEELEKEIEILAMRVIEECQNRPCKLNEISI